MERFWEYEFYIRVLYAWEYKFYMCGNTSSTCVGIRVLGIRYLSLVYQGIESEIDAIDHA